MLDCWDGCLLSDPGLGGGCSVFLDESSCAADEGCGWSAAALTCNRNHVGALNIDCIDGCVLPDPGVTADCSGNTDGDSCAADANCKWDDAYQTCLGVLRGTVSLDCIDGRLLPDE